MTNKHIILDHLAQSKGLIRKDLVTFICINNGYDGHKQGYYGTAIQEWEREGYIQKVGKKWCIAPLGKTYLKTPKVATLKAKVVKLTKGMANWKDNYYEMRDEMLDYKKAVKDGGKGFVKEIVKGMNEVGDEMKRLRDENDAMGSTIQSLREANFDADNSDEIHILESKLSTSRNNEMLMEEEANRWLNQNKDTRDLLVKAQLEKDELEEALKDLTAQYNGLYSDYQDELDSPLPYNKSLLILALETLREQSVDDNNQEQVDRINIEISEIKGCSRDTLTLQPPPSTELGDFTKAELIKLIKGML